MSQVDEVSKGILIGPGFGRKRREDEVEEYYGTPFYAKALELAAKESRARADMNDVPWPGCSLKMGGSRGKKDDLNEKKRKAKREELDKIRSAWMRLHADCLEWCAKQERADDSTQKSLNKCISGYGDLSGKLKVFEGTPYLAQALECLAEQKRISGELSFLSYGDMKGGVWIDPDKKKRDRLGKKKDKHRKNFFDLQAKALQYMAKQQRNNGDVAQKSLPQPERKPVPYGKHEVTPMRAEEKCKDDFTNRRGSSPGVNVLFELKKGCQELRSVVEGLSLSLQGKKSD